MMKQVWRLAVCVIGLMAMASVASAQALPWEGRGFVNLNFGMQIRSESAVTSTSSFQLYDETGSITTAQTIDTQAPFLDFGGGFRVAGNFGIGFAYTRLSTEGAGAVSAKVPSPIFYDQPRTATATADALEHTENGYHIQLVWMLPISDKMDVIFTAGPSFFKLTQGVVGDPTVTEVGAPYTSVNMTVAASTVTDSPFGFNIGADLSYRITNTFGVGAMMRYAGATAKIEPKGGTATDVNVGGFQLGGGLRIRF